MIEESRERSLLRRIGAQLRECIDCGCFSHPYHANHGGQPAFGLDGVITSFCKDIECLLASDPRPTPAEEAADPDDVSDPHVIMVVPERLEGTLVVACARHLASMADHGTVDELEEAQELLRLTVLR